MNSVSQSRVSHYNVLSWESCIVSQYTHSQSELFSCLLFVFLCITTFFCLFYSKGGRLRTKEKSLWGIASIVKWRSSTSIAGWGQRGMMEAPDSWQRRNAGCVQRLPVKVMKHWWQWLTLTALGGWAAQWWACVKKDMVDSYSTGMSVSKVLGRKAIGRLKAWSYLKGAFSINIIIKHGKENNYLVENTHYNSKYKNVSIMIPFAMVIHILFFFVIASYCHLYLSSKRSQVYHLLLVRFFIYINLFLSLQILPQLSEPEMY